jgi:hypothetical protein
MNVYNGVRKDVEVEKQVEKEMENIFKTVPVVKRGDKTKERGKLYNINGIVRCWDGNNFRSYKRSKIFKDLYYNALKKKNIDSASGEIWKTIPNITSHEISNMGRCRSKKTGRILNGCVNDSGYLRVDLGKKKKYTVHRLVALTFIPNPNNKKTVDHINRNRLDNRVINLRWATIGEQHINRKTPIKKNKKIWRKDKESNKKIQLHDSIQDAMKWLVDNNYCRMEKKIDKSGHHKIPYYQGGNIRAAARKERLSSYGFKWEYYEPNKITYKNEKWFDIPYHLIGCKGYKICYSGVIKRPNGEIVKGVPLAGYLVICIQSSITNKNHTHRIHRLMAQTFLPNWLNKNIVNHKNRNKTDNRLFNLEWVTHSENVIHSYTEGEHKSNINMQVIFPDGKIKNYRSKNEIQTNLKISRHTFNKYIKNNSGLGKNKWEGYQFIEIK